MFFFIYGYGCLQHKELRCFANTVKYSHSQSQGILIRNILIHSIVKLLRKRCQLIRNDRTIDGQLTIGRSETRMYGVGKSKHDH